MNAIDHLRLGRSLRDAGRLADAIENIRRAVAADPSLAEAHRSLSDLIVHQSFDEDMLMMERLWLAGRPAQRVHAGFGLAKALCDIGEHEKSVVTYRDVNRLQARLRPFDLDRARQSIRATTAYFRDAATPQSSGRGKTLVFVIGLPRSGKSTIERELAATEGAFASGESSLLAKLAEATADFDVIGREYERAATHVAGTRTIVNSSPNWKLVGHIRHSLPAARVIHAVRGGAEHRIAMLQKHFAFSHGYTNSPAMLLDYETLHRDMMAFWHSIYPGFISDQRAAGPSIPSGQVGAWLKLEPALFD